ncbi:MAG TPA: MBOAT family O-acyltransferase [Polyangia bacterium]|nr:MBOAT family O-acyltransferase [Polyangia bacterium]
MNYNSYSFWLLFAALYVLYWRAGHRWQNRLLLGASYIFYGAWDYRFLFLILISTVIDYLGGLGVAGKQLPRDKQRWLGVLIVGSALILCSHVRYPALFAALIHGDGGAVAAALPHSFRDFLIPLGTALVALAYGFVLPSLFAAPEARRRKIFLTISMVANLAILGFFKYCDFFITSFVALLHAFGLGNVSWQPLGVILPAGISFYTFQAMSYTIDIYRGDAQPTENFPDFALFVCFFPHLVAGPIMRAHTLLPQVVNPRPDPRRTEVMREGLALVVIGLFKKLFIADNMATVANGVFFRFFDGKSAGITGPEVLLGIYAFAFQIYGDFSGYSAIARGISKWLGFELVMNFRLPYLAVSPSDFWTRWHISLSSWLRDYLYIPLGGNRRGIRIQYRNLMITMLLGGLWHGASFTFVAWGLYHGGILCAFRLLGISDNLPRQTPHQKLHWLFRVIVMFHLTCAGWLLFRADTFHSAFEMAVRIFTNFRVTDVIAAPLVQVIFYGFVPLLIECTVDGEKHLQRFLRAPWPVRSAAYAYMLLALLIFHASQANEFIYFQF